MQKKEKNAENARTFSVLWLNLLTKPERREIYRRLCATGAISSRATIDNWAKTGHGSRNYLVRKNITDVINEYLNMDYEPEELFPNSQLS